MTNAFTSVKPQTTPAKVARIRKGKNMSQNLTGVGLPDTTPGVATNTFPFPGTPPADTKKEATVAAATAAADAAVKALTTTPPTPATTAVQTAVNAVVGQAAAPAAAPAPAQAKAPAPAPAPAAAPAVTEAKGSVVGAQFDVPEKPADLLVQILRTRRRHTSQGDYNFRRWLQGHLTSMGHTPTIKAQGTLMVVTDPKSATLWSCHVDTVHSMTESNGAFQDLIYDQVFGHIALAKDQPQGPAGCLGADDGAGVYILLRLIEAKVPGTYLFHVGEEVGGVGAYALASSDKGLLEGFDRAIAFDRKGTQDIVVTQGGTSCASVVFGQELAKALNKHGMDMAVSHGGTFTDVKAYASIIPECVNISCGYENAHSPREYLDVGALEALIKAVIATKVDDIKATRVPPKEPVYDRHAARNNPGYGGNGYGGYGHWDDDDVVPPKGGFKGSLVDAGKKNKKQQKKQQQQQAFTSTFDLARELATGLIEEGSISDIRDMLDTTDSELLTQTVVMLVFEARKQKRATEEALMMLEI